MSYKISNQTVIDDSRNVDGVKVTANSRCATNVGDTASRTSTPTAGSIRHNTETGFAEYFNGTDWIELISVIPTPEDQGTRALFGGGSSSNVIDYINISTTSNATDFGDLTAARDNFASCSSSTRGIWAGGIGSNVIDYVTIASVGNATDFGDLSNNRFGLAGASNSTRGIFAGGSTSQSPPYPTLTTIDYITIATTGNATLFGSLTATRVSLGAVSNPTTAVFAGGNSTSGGTGTTNVIDYVTIASVGNATDFGDLSYPRYSISGCSSPTRGVFAGGIYFDAPSGTSPRVNIIDYTTFGTRSIATDFGDMVSNGKNNYASTSNSIRGVFAGGTSLSAPYPVTSAIDYITIASSSNSTAFGNLTTSRVALAGCSDGHGGL